MALQLSRNYNIPRILIEQGGDLDARDLEGKTPLHTFPSPVLEQTLRCRSTLIDLDIQDYRGMSILHYLAWSSKSTKEMFQRYHERSNIDLRTIDSEARSMLQLSAQRGNVLLVEYLLSQHHNLDLNHRDMRGMTALHYGVESKRAPATVSLLLSHGVNPRIKDKQGRTALHHAMKLGNAAAVTALLSLGTADELCVIDVFGMTPLQVLSHRTAQDVFALLGKSRGSLREDEKEYSALPLLRHDGGKLRSCALPSCAGHLPSCPMGGMDWYSKMYAFGRENLLYTVATMSSIMIFLYFVSLIAD